MRVRKRVIRSPTEQGKVSADQRNYSDKPRQQLAIGFSFRLCNFVSRAYCWSNCGFHDASCLGFTQRAID